MGLEKHHILQKHISLADYIDKLHDEEIPWLIVYNLSKVFEEWIRGNFWSKTEYAETISSFPGATDKMRSVEYNQVPKQSRSFVVEVEVIPLTNRPNPLNDTAACSKPCTSTHSFFKKPNTFANKVTRISMTPRPGWRGIKEQKDAAKTREKCQNLDILKTSKKLIEKEKLR